MIHKSESFFNQYLQVSSIDSRIDFFISYLKGKSVLHIGCADAMFFRTDINLHMKIKKEIGSIIGYDIDAVAITELQKSCPGEYYSSYDDIKDKQFDSIIVPEVLEHISNPEIFLDEIFKIRANEYIITVPNCFTYAREMLYNGNTFKEIVHPDHKYWFSPYTLFNITRKYHTPNMKLFLLEKNSMVAIIIKRG